jgi:hypothetical protein
MNISVQKLLNKIEAELIEAKKTQSDAKVREHVYAVKALCELILEEQTTTKNNTLTAMPTSTVVQPVDIPKQSRLKEDDGANGDSLFDF